VAIGIAVVRRIVDDDHARDGREGAACLLGRDRAGRLHVDRLRVAHEDGHAHGRARDAQVRQMQDLATLGDDLPLFAGVAVLQEDVDLGQGVEGDRVRVDRGDLRLARDVGADLRLELGSASAPVPDTDW
jgi:hypothetical protein